MKRDADQHFAQAMAWETKNNFAEAVREYEATLCDEPRHIRACLHLGFLYSGVGELDLCVKEFQKAWELQHDIASLLSKDIEQRTFYQRKLQATLDALNKPVIQSPSNAYAHFRVGTACRYLGRLEQALTSLKTAIDLNPRLFEAYTMSAQIFIDMEQFQQAVGVLKSGIGLNPRDAEMHASLGIAYDRQNKGALAVQAMEKAIEIEPDSARYHLTLGRILSRQDKHKPAIREYQRSMDLDRGNPDVHFALAEACEAVYRPDLAIQMLREAVALNPYFAEAHFKLGLTHFQLGQADEAIKSFKDTLEINPNDAYAHYHLAEACQRLGKIDLALTHFVQAVSLNPQDSYAHFNLGRTLDLLGRSAEALPHMERAATLNPNDLNLRRTLEEVRERAEGRAALLQPPADASSMAVEEAVAAAEIVSTTVHPPPLDETASVSQPYKYTVARPTAYDAFESLDGPLLWDEDDDEEESVEAEAAAAEPPESDAGPPPETVEEPEETPPEEPAEAPEPAVRPYVPPVLEEKALLLELERTLAEGPQIPTPVGVDAESNLRLSESLGLSESGTRSSEPGQQLLGSPVGRTSGEMGWSEPSPARSEHSPSGSSEIERVRAPIESVTAAQRGADDTPARPRSLRRDTGAARAESATAPPPPARPTLVSATETRVEEPAAEPTRSAPPAAQMEAFVAPSQPQAPPAEAPQSAPTPKAVHMPPPILSGPTRARKGGSGPPRSQTVSAVTPPPLPYAPTPPATPPAPPATPPASPTLVEVSAEAPPVSAVRSARWMPDQPGTATPYQRAIAALSEGRLDEARAQFQGLLETDDSDYRAMFFLAWSLKLLGDRFLASQFFAIGIKIAEAANDEAFLPMYRAEIGTQTGR